MNGFENYTVNAWLVDCMTRHPQNETRPTITRIKSTSAVVSILATLTACAALESISLAADSVSPVLYQPMAVMQKVDAANLVQERPAIYWSKAIAEVGSWKRVEETDGIDPPLPF